ncbi:hypothetical protein BGZ76_003146, partial [Entomortierella beljakovae]
MVAEDHSPHGHYGMELLIPIGLLFFTILSGAYRNDSISNLGLVIVILNYLVGFMFITSLALICIRAIIVNVWTGTLLVIYDLTSIVAIAANLTLMHVELTIAGRWGWANYWFWWLILGGETLITFIHLDNGIEGAYGTFASVFRSSEDNEDQKKSSQPTLGSTTDEEMQKRLQKEQEERDDAFKDFWPKIKQLIPLVFPSTDRWLQFLILLTPIFIGLERIFNLLVPLQTDRVIKQLYQGG